MSHKTNPMSAGRAAGWCLHGKSMAQGPVALLAQNSWQMPRGSPVFLLHNTAFMLYCAPLTITETVAASRKSLFATLTTHITTAETLCFLQGKRSLGPENVGSFLVRGLTALTEPNSSNIHCSVNTEIPSSMHQSLPHPNIPEQTGV